MNKQEVKEQIAIIFGISEKEISSIRNLKDKGVSVGLDFEIEDIKFGLKELRAIGEFFGTDSVDVDDYAKRGGCKTCDYGSGIEHTFQVKNITKNNPFGENV